MRIIRNLLVVNNFVSLMDSIKKHGDLPFNVVLLHGGPGARGGMQSLAREISMWCGVLELIQTKSSVEDLLGELKAQLDEAADLPVVIIGHSWGAWLGVLFASRYQEIVRKLILVGAGSFEKKYTQTLLGIRMSRLSSFEQKRTTHLLHEINSGRADKNAFREFGILIEQADTYCSIDLNERDIEPDLEQYRLVWSEASKWRDSGMLTNSAALIACPVVAIHGRYDSHAIEGVSEVLPQVVKNFRMELLEQCGHTPWKEKYARDAFFELLKKEILF